MADTGDEMLRPDIKANEADKNTRHVGPALHPDEGKYRDLVEQIPVITYTAATDEVGSTHYVSPQIESILQFPAQMWMENPTMWSKQIHPDDEKRVLNAWSICYEEDRAFQVEYRMFARDGTIRWFRDEAELIQDRDGKPLLIQGVMLDITKQKNAEQELITSAKRLKALSRHLVEIQEVERYALSNELHDRVGQALSALGLDLRLLSSKLDQLSTTEITEIINDCMKLIEDTTNATRDVMGELRPQILDDLGLLAALDIHGKSFTKRTGIVVDVTGDENLNITNNVELAMFRIAQEALNNVAKYSKASTVKITYQCNDEVTQLKLADDGIGLNQDRVVESSTRGGWGLSIMRERAEAVGAQFELDSQPGHGVQITITYPG